MKKIVRSQGFSKLISLPSGMCKNLGIEIGTVLNVEQKGNEIVIKKNKDTVVEPVEEHNCPICQLPTSGAPDLICSECEKFIDETV